LDVFQVAFSVVMHEVVIVVENELFQLVLLLWMFFRLLFRLLCMRL